MNKHVPIPAQMRHLPRDPRGLPITYTSLRLPDGRYDFTQADTLLWLECAVHRKCALCGVRLPKKMWFVGGPLCMLNRVFFDLGMHEDCARYALIVCPYLAVRGYRQVKRRNIGAEEVAWQKTLASSDTTKPEAFGLAQTDGYSLAEFQDDHLVRAKRWIKPIEWWDAGRRVEAPARYRELWERQAGQARPSELVTAQAEPRFDPKIVASDERALRLQILGPGRQL